MWNKLQVFFATKDLPNRMYLRHNFFTCKMDSTKSLIVNLDKFKKIVVEFNNIGEKLIR